MVCVCVCVCVWNLLRHISFLEFTEGSVRERLEKDNRTHNHWSRQLPRIVPVRDTAQLAGPNHSHTEQGRALCVLERALPTELLRQLSWLGRITHTQSTLCSRGGSTN